jgi:hypothetical protein
VLQHTSSVLCSRKKHGYLYSVTKVAVNTESIVCYCYDAVSFWHYNLKSLIVIDGHVLLVVSENLEPSVRGAICLLLCAVCSISFCAPVFVTTSYWMCEHSFFLKLTSILNYLLRSNILGVFYLSYY